MVKMAKKNAEIIKHQKKNMDNSLTVEIVKEVDAQLKENPKMKCVKERVEALKKYALKIKED